MKKSKNYWPDNRPANSHSALGWIAASWCFMRLVSFTSSWAKKCKEIIWYITDFTMQHFNHPINFIGLFVEDLAWHSPASHVASCHPPWLLFHHEWKYAERFTGDGDGRCRVGCCRIHKPFLTVGPPGDVTANIPRALTKKRCRTSSSVFVCVSWCIPPSMGGVSRGAVGKAAAYPALTHTHTHSHSSQ